MLRKLQQHQRKAALALAAEHKMQWQQRQEQLQQLLQQYQEQTTAYLLHGEQEIVALQQRITDLEGQLAARTPPVTPSVVTPSDAPFPATKVSCEVQGPYTWDLPADS
jgi:hypothetical protein